MGRVAVDFGVGQGAKRSADICSDLGQESNAGQRQNQRNHRGREAEGQLAASLARSSPLRGCASLAPCHPPFCLYARPIPVFQQSLRQSVAPKLEGRAPSRPRAAPAAVNEAIPDVPVSFDALAPLTSLVKAYFVSPCIITAPFSRFFLLRSSFLLSSCPCAPVLSRPLIAGATTATGTSPLTRPQSSPMVATQGPTSTPPPMLPSPPAMSLSAPRTPI